MSNSKIHKKIIELKNEEKNFKTKEGIFPLGNKIRNYQINCVINPIIINSNNINKYNNK